MNCKNRLQDIFSNYGMIKILCSFIFFFMITVDIALFIGVSYYFDIRKFEIFSSGQQKEVCNNYTFML